MLRFFAAWTAVERLQPMGVERLQPLLIVRI
jgi:hypothetical protein